MNTQSILEVADRIVSEKTGKHLTDLQLDLLQAACENKTYEEFALSRGYCLDYIKKDVGAELWHVLSTSLGEKVTKKNFRHAFERYYQLFVINSDNELPSVNFFHSVETPHLSTFCSIQSNKSPIIALINCGEQQKNLLIDNLLEKIPDDFPLEDKRYALADHLVSLQQVSESKKCVDQGIYRFPRQEEAKKQIYYLLYQYLTNFPCLIILDNIDNLFTAMELGKENPPNSHHVKS